jgi:hypothetical protein
MDEYDVGELEDLEDEMGIVGARNRRQVQPKKVRLLTDYAKGKYRVQPLPFDGQTLTAAGAFVLTATADRPCKPVRIIVFHTQVTAGVEQVNFDGITVQGINQLLGAGLIPSSAFAEDAPAEDLPWDFAVLTSNGTMVMNGNLVAYTSGTVYCWAVARVIATQQ